MLVQLLALWQALGFPEVEDPVPDRIGLGFVVAFSGAGATLAGLLRFGSAPAKRDREVRRGALIGFCIGAAVYLLSLLAELVSAL